MRVREDLPILGDESRSKRQGCGNNDPICRVGMDWLRQFDGKPGYRIIHRYEVEKCQSFAFLHPQGRGDAQFKPSPPLEHEDLPDAD